MQAAPSTRAMICRCSPAPETVQRVLHTPLHSGAVRMREAPVDRLEHLLVRPGKRAAVLCHFARTRRRAREAGLLHLVLHRGDQRHAAQRDTDAQIVDIPSDARMTTDTVRVGSQEVAAKQRGTRSIVLRALQPLPRTHRGALLLGIAIAWNGRARLVAARRWIPALGLGGLHGTIARGPLLHARDRHEQDEQGHELSHARSIHPFSRSTPW